MNNNIMNNLQALTFLINLENQRQSSMLAALTSNPAFNSPYTTQTPLFQPPTIAPSFLNPLQAQKQDEFLSRVYHNNLQTELLKYQMMSATKTEPFTAQSQTTLIPNEICGNIYKQQNVLPTSGHSLNLTQEAQVRNILDFVILNFGILSQSEIEREKQRYSHDETLHQVFNNLLLKYTSMNKTKEEMIKYVFRKALKSIKEKLKGKIRKSDKEVTKVFLQTYFSVSKEEMQRKNGVDVEDEDELLNFLLPFKKTSTNKTLNASFFAKIFASEEFCQAYNEYLVNFEREADYDNTHKVNKFVDYIMTCIKSNKVSQILNYKRVPWLKSWIISTKNTGYQLMYEKSPRKIRKIDKLEKLEFVSPKEFETSESEYKLEEGSTAASG